MTDPNLQNQTQDELIAEVESLRQCVAEIEGELIRWRRPERSLKEDAEGERERRVGLGTDGSGVLQSQLALSNAILEGTTDAIYIKDLQGRYLLINRAGTEILDKTVEEIIGKDDTQLFEPDAARQLMANDRRIMAEAKTETFEEHATADGVSRWYFTTKGPYYDAQGKVIGVFGISRDITGRKRTERLLHTITEGTAPVTGADFFPSFVRALARAFESRYVLVCEHLDSPPQRVRTLAFWMGDHLGENVVYDVAGGPCEETVSGEMTFYPEGIQELFSDDKDLVSLGAESYCGIPLYDRSGGIIGHIALMDDRPMDVNICETPVVQILVARAAAEIERKQTEDALRLTQFAIDNSPAAEFFLKSDGKFFYVNEAAIRSLGYSRQELMSLRVSDIDPLHPAES